jgi:16S rRNA (adenine(1408)-N(1))-methyltransferase
VLAAAAAQPDRLVVGVDANAAGMMTASRRAAARPSRGGLPNALFVVATVEALPAELDEVADLVTVHFPWGSLLRGLLGADPATMSSLTRVLRPGATLQLLVSSTDRDRGAGVPPIQPAALHTLAASYATWGLAVTQLRPATVADVAAAHSSWASAWVPAPDAASSPLPCSTPTSPPGAGRLGRDQPNRRPEPHCRHCPGGAGNQPGRRRPKPITSELLADADLVITMSRHPTGPSLPDIATHQQHWQLDFLGDDLEAMRTFCDQVDGRVQALLADLPPSGPDRDTSSRPA